MELVYCDGVEANREQVAMGMAHVYLKYNKDDSLWPLQRIAVMEKRGLWIDPTCAALGVAEAETN